MVLTVCESFFMASNNYSASLNDNSARMKQENEKSQESGGCKMSAHISAQILRINGVLRSGH